ncbi:GL25493 [Drosophila persimilis]|uniref:GL25493 n=1 Tax=Drosophila persimilis TaxID=7234 RepID=B4GU90_DROPE|nr:GL25493 [Drosophila persimilis]
MWKIALLLAIGCICVASQATTRAPRGSDVCRRLNDRCLRNQDRLGTTNDVTQIYNSNCRRSQANWRDISRCDLARATCQFRPNPTSNSAHSTHSTYPTYPNSTDPTPHTNSSPHTYSPPYTNSAHTANPNSPHSSPHAYSPPYANSAHTANPNSPHSSPHTYSPPYANPSPNAYTPHATPTDHSATHFHSGI